jgi:hypothetical protein
MDGSPRPARAKTASTTRASCRCWNATATTAACSAHAADGAPEGSFLASGSGWYPRPAELFTYRVKLAVPHGQRALVAGKRIAENLPAAPAKATGPASNAPAERWHRPDGRAVDRARENPGPSRASAHLPAHFFPADLDAQPGLAQGYLDDSAAYIERYSRAIGAYPYSEFSIVASPLPTGFGMPTLTYLGAEVLRLPFIRKTSLGHEVLHNWWGNGVYVDYRAATGRKASPPSWPTTPTSWTNRPRRQRDAPGLAARRRRPCRENTGTLRDFRSRATPPAPRSAMARQRCSSSCCAIAWGNRPSTRASATSGPPSVSGSPVGTTCRPPSKAPRARSSAPSLPPGSTSRPCPMSPLPTPRAPPSARLAARPIN